MSRPAEELLEFDRLKEIVGGFTTCAPGLRAVQALVPQQDVARSMLNSCSCAKLLNICAPAPNLVSVLSLIPMQWLGRLVIPVCLCFRARNCSMLLR